MCLWLITACLGILPTNSPPPNIIIVQGVPTPILLPTTTPAPAATTAAPAPTTAAPAPTTAAPAPTTAAPAPPAPTTAAPAPTTAAPAPTTAAPAPTTAAPAPTTAAPAPTTAAPAPTTAAPAPTTAAPAPTTAAPAPTTAAPAPTTAAPAPTTAAPAPTTAAPAPTTAAPAPTTAGGLLLPVLICDNPDLICISNPDESDAGPLPIDPRLGTTPGSSAALQVQPCDTAVKFPRDRRSVDIGIKNLFNAFRTETDGHKHNIHKRQSCRCVISGTCVKTSSGAGMIDIRIVTPVSQCPTGQEYCCGSTTSQAGVACGVLQPVPPTTTVPTGGQSYFGEYPWQVLVLTKQNDYITGGVLIDQLNVITVTHKLTTYIVSGTAPNLKVRLGDWDVFSTIEPIPFKEYDVVKVFSHPSYNPNTLQYDLTVLRLSGPVPFTPANGSTTSINRACLPPAASSVYNGLRCRVSGWGKDQFGMAGQYQQIMKAVEVPIVPPDTCQMQMQAARLGPTFVLDTTSFICAGGEANKDACTGDGGSGLVCQVNGQWVVVGLVAWGLGCASANVPAAYVNIAGLLPWIQQQIAAA